MTQIVKLIDARGQSILLDDAFVFVDEHFSEHGRHSRRIQFTVTGFTYTVSTSMIRKLIIKFLLWLAERLNNKAIQAGK